MTRAELRDVFCEFYTADETEQILGRSEVKDWHLKRCSAKNARKILSFAQKINVPLDKVHLFIYTFVRAPKTVEQLMGILMKLAKKLKRDEFDWPTCVYNFASPNKIKDIIKELGSDIYLINGCPLILAQSSVDRIRKIKESGDWQIACEKPSRLLDTTGAIDDFERFKKKTEEKAKACEVLLGSKERLKELFQEFYTPAETEQILAKKISEYKISKGNINYAREILSFAKGLDFPPDKLHLLVYTFSRNPKAVKELIATLAKVAKDIGHDPFDWPVDVYSSSTSKKALGIIEELGDDKFLINSCGSVLANSSAKKIRKIKSILGYDWDWIIKERPHILMSDSEKEIDKVNKTVSKEKVSKGKKEEREILIQEIEQERGKNYTTNVRWTLETGRIERILSENKLDISVKELLKRIPLTEFYKYHKKIFSNEYLPNTKEKYNPGKLYLRVMGMYNRMLNWDEINKFCEYKKITKKEFCLKILKARENAVNFLKNSKEIWVGSSIPVPEDLKQKHYFLIHEIARKLAKKICSEFKTDYEEMKDWLLEIITDKTGGLFINYDGHQRAMKGAVYAFAEECFKRAEIHARARGLPFLSVGVKAFDEKYMAAYVDDEQFESDIEDIKMAHSGKLEQKVFDLMKKLAFTDCMDIQGQVCDELGISEREFAGALKNIQKSVLAANPDVSVRTSRDSRGRR